MRKNIIYHRFGKSYKKVDSHEKIEVGAMHCFNGGELSPIKGFDTIGDIPASFSDEREFFNPIESEKVVTHPITGSKWTVL